MNKRDNLKRVIVDFKKLTPEILSLLVEKYPDGYDDDHIISFRNASNELIEAVEVISGDTKYLVKVSTKLAASMESFEDDDDTVNSEVPDVGEDPELTEDNLD
ncbi:MAG: hypothetical protein HRU26_10670 [Psychroserpens sp.]|nr:hypothetical protein [Psychroserpens sp.]